MYLNSLGITDPELYATQPPTAWFAVRTRPRHEKAAAHRLKTVGIETFLPLCAQVRSWSDRRKIIDLPLFPGYAFVRIARSTQARARVFNVTGVVGFVGPNNQATPIPTEQIEAVRSLMKARVGCRPHPYLHIGQRVRIQSGALQGVEGILVRIANDHSLVVSIDLIQRSVAVQLEGYQVDCL